MCIFDYMFYWVKCPVIFFAHCILNCLNWFIRYIYLTYIVQIYVSYKSMICTHIHFSPWINSLSAICITGILIKYVTCHLIFLIPFSFKEWRFSVVMKTDLSVCSSMVCAFSVLADVLLPIFVCLFYCLLREEFCNSDNWGFVFLYFLYIVESVTRRELVHV